MKLFSCSIFLLFFLSPFHLVLANDQSYEDRIHNIYLKHYKNPITYQAWSNAINNLKKSYKLKHRDNLWNLSHTFFNNNLYWSKLWVANHMIENPHLIYKGNSLKLDMQTLSQANHSKYSTPIAKLFPNVDLPLNPHARDALKETEIPSSLPYIKNTVYLKPADIDTDTGISFSEDSHFINKRAPLPFYLNENKPESVGEVIGKNGYGSLSLNGEHIIVKINSAISIGGRYTIVKNKGSLASSILNLFKGKGYEIQVQGEIKILSYISGTESLYKAQITKSLNGIRKGDSIIFGSIPVYTLSQKGRHGAVNGILMGSPNKRIKLLSLYSLVYLNKGSLDGVNVNDLYFIRSDNRQLKNRMSSFYKNPVVGELRVIHTTASTSTATIIKADNQIYINDLFSGSSNEIQNFKKSNEHEQIDEDLEREEIDTGNEDLEEEFEEEEEDFNEDSEDLEGEDLYNENSLKEEFEEFEQLEDIDEE